MCFVWISEQTAIISLYSINWLVFITETECVYCAVRTECLTFNNSTFCPHSVFMCFVWISEQTAIISLYSINWPVCIAETDTVKFGVLSTVPPSVHISGTLALCLWSSSSRRFVKPYCLHLQDQPFLADRSTRKMKALWSFDASRTTGTHRFLPHSNSN
jgi:hypothetical protein